jgi:hypothetical protein
MFKIFRCILLVLYNLLSLNNTYFFTMSADRPANSKKLSSKQRAIEVQRIMLPVSLESMDQKKFYDGWELLHGATKRNGKHWTLKALRPRGKKGGKNAKRKAIFLDSDEIGFQHKTKEIAEANRIDAATRLVRFIEKEEDDKKNGVGSGTHHHTLGGSGQAPRVQTTKTTDGRKNNGKEAAGTIDDTEREAREKHRQLLKNRDERELSFAQKTFNPKVYLKWYHEEGRQLPFTGNSFSNEKSKKAKNDNNF